MRNHPWFLYLIVLFFFLLGLGQFGPYILLSSLLVPFTCFSLLALIIHLGFRKKDNRQAVYQMSFVLLVCYLFFEDIHHFAKETVILRSLSSYTLFLPLLLILCTGLFLVLKKYHTRLSDVSLFLNRLMLILCVIQGFMVMNRYLKPAPAITTNMSFQTNQSTSQPDIYLVLFDEYPGLRSQHEFFKLDTRNFENALKQEGFHIQDSIQSNYTITVASMSSLLNMQYVDTAKLMPVNNYSLFLKCFRSINQNNFVSLLKKSGYSIHNHSIFNLDHQEAPQRFELLKQNADLVMKKTFFQQLKKDVLWNLWVGKHKMDFFVQRYLLQVHHQNNRAIQDLLSQQWPEHTGPHFSYTHLMLPHEPFFTDSTGRLYNEQYDQKDSLTKVKDYIRYTNKRMIEIAKALHKRPNAIVLLLSDHGYRDYPDSLNGFKFDNFMAISLPDQQYDEIRNIRTNVNIFRFIANRFLNQKLPMLPDQRFLIDEEKNRIQSFDTDQISSK
ncbi:MAG: sulfatase-like hydrolase/transferase [Chitinophagaceae bacterium]|nr:sulfatase-like hydrolase/transferase [Chitinophagaceae bacterium]